MPRHLSFALTTPQVRARQKTVTRRLGWRFLKVGDQLVAVEKSQGLGKGGKAVRICNIRVVDVRQETLWRMVEEPDYGREECAREGYPKSSPETFVEFFCSTHKGCEPGTEITRIEFEYL